MIRILLILILLFYTNITHSKEPPFDEVYKFKEKIVHDAYDELVWESEKKITIDGKTKKIKLILRFSGPSKKEYTKKNWKCAPWRVGELSHEGKYLLRTYTLNDCLPCIDASTGHICSYPYFKIVFTTELYSLYYYGETNQGIDALDKLYGKRDYKLMDLKDDGTKEIEIMINVGTREKFHLKKVRHVTLGNFYASNIVKYNTRLREIKTKETITKFVEKMKYKLVFDRVVDKAYELLSKPDELKIREKDLRILFDINQSASFIRFQTRD